MTNQKIEHAGHVIYSDGTVYRNGEFIGQYRSVSQAKKAAELTQEYMLGKVIGVHPAKQG